MGSVFVSRLQEFITSLLDKLPPEVLGHAGTLNGGSETMLAALEVALFVDRAHSHIIMAHDEIEGQLTPATDHLVGLTTGVVSKELHTLGALQLLCLTLNGDLLCEVRLLQRVAHQLQVG